ncbi:hypothetical protein [Brevundimonas nasdae]|uniref:hypothetical protein n=1 Tax=Brevundimonas nasdae TaxID=172043 RepID=UPI00289B8E5A|nr:hypothetical protein [Brevundimonas nasdae]
MGLLQPLAESDISEALTILVAAILPAKLAIFVSRAGGWRSGYGSDGGRRGA